MRTGAGWLALSCLSLTLWASSAGAYYLDKGRRFDVRLRAYSQLGILTEDAETLGNPPQYDAGDLGQHRNFYNPEFDARLTDFTRWMGDAPGLRFIRPDDFKFRFAWWGFYDGIYDYLNPEWNDRRRTYLTRFSETDDLDETRQFNDQNKNPRHIYASRNRINELYVDYTKGRFFTRIGRQGISWGESDSIALLDVSNPFDLTLGAPGLFQDVDEARIPLWTIRSTIKLVDNWRFLSGLFADMYLVPGVIDTTVPINPITAGISPFNPDVSDPQQQIIAQGQGGLAHLVLADRIPEKKWSNSRWGVRLTSILFRDYTVQGWFFRTFNQAPMPRLVSPGGIDLNSLGLLRKTVVDDRGFRTDECLGISGGATNPNGVTPAGRSCGPRVPIITILERRLENVIGLSATWFNQWVNGIIRTELEYFLDELAFIPTKNLNARSQIPRSIQVALGQEPVQTSSPKADYLRGLLGYDRFFFFRALNPSNSITLSMALNMQYNLSGSQFRNPQPKPGKPQAENAVVPGVPGCETAAAAAANPLCVTTPSKNFEDQYRFETFLQTAFQSDYMHGKLTPRLVIILDPSGTFAFVTSATYRITDSFLAGLSWIAIESTRKSGIATFRAHDMLQLRLTYQLN
jgi:hypothetical protein